MVYNPDTRQTTNRDPGTWALLDFQESSTYFQHVQAVALTTKVQEQFFIDWNHSQFQNDF